MNIDCGDLGVGLTLVDEKNGPKMMETVNRSLVKDSGLIFKEFFSLLTRPDSLPLLFHCTAGKDRTGFAAALFLSALGVRRGDIFRDYLLSSVGARKKFGPLVEKMPRLISIVTVRPGYLEAAFDEIERNFCSVENYLVKELEVDLDKLRYIFAA